MRRQVVYFALVQSCCALIGGGMALAQLQNDRSGESAGAVNPSTPSPNETGRTEQITRSATGSVAISDAQRRQLNEYFSKHPEESGGDQDLGVTIGAAVPRQVQLRPLPAELTNLLQKYQGNSYLLVKHALVIVEPKVRRVVAIIP